MYACLLAGALLAYGGATDVIAEPVGTPAVQLLNDPAVQPLLELSADQKSSLHRDLQRYLQLRVQRASETRSGRRSGAEELDKIDVESARIATECTKYLTRDQKARFTEISWQLLGPDAFAIPKYRKALALTQEDLDRIEPVLERFVAEFRELHAAFAKGKLTLEQFRRQAAKLEAAATERSVSMLSEASRAAYRERCGTPAGISKWMLRTEWQVEDAAVAEEVKPEPSPPNRVAP